MAGTPTHTSPITLNYYKNNFAGYDASPPQTKLRFRRNNTVLEYKQFTILLPTTVPDEGVMAKQRDTTEQQATGVSRKGVQKKWEVGTHEKERKIITSTELPQDRSELSLSFTPFKISSSLFPSTLPINYHVVLDHKQAI
jgi:hypothetical protein